MELGSEYDLDLNKLNITSNNLFHYLESYNCQFFDSGRSALRHIPFNQNKAVLLPEFICESVSNCFPSQNIIFYNITEDLQIDLDDLKRKITPQVATLYICHYFGAVQSAQILSYLRRMADECGIMIIEDTTQSFFSINHITGDYMIASIRKWLPIPLGGVLYTKKAQDLPALDHIKTSSDNTRSYGMILKNLFLKNELDCNAKYRQIFTECEEKLDTSDEILQISDFSRFLISCIDIPELIAARRSNYHFLTSELQKIGLQPVCALAENDCPLVFPLRVKNRDSFRSYLMEHKIYCAVHWPFDHFRPEFRPMAQKNAETLISFPIDQRYQKNDMTYLRDIIFQYGGELLF